jgi:hypothetical protein
MPQNQPRRSDMWWRGHNDAQAGDPPNESFYHYYYDYKLAYDQVRREQRRSHMQRTLARTARRMAIIGPVLLAIVALGVWGWVSQQGNDATTAAEVVPTRTPRPTPRPTLTPIPPTPEPVLQADGFAVITGTGGVSLLVRSNPGTDASLVTRVAEGETVRILEGPQSANEYEWWRVEVNGASGWAAAPFLKPVGPEAPTEATSSPS